MAYSVAIRGFHARVTSNTNGIDFVDRLIPPVKDLNLQMLNLHFDERKARCRKLGIEERQETITNETIYNSLLSNHVPMLVTNALFCKGENLPHWITVTGIDDKFVYFNNPLDVSPRKRKFNLSILHKTVGFRGNQSMVEIWRQK
jgi:hypothetical protein